MTILLGLLNIGLLASLGWYFFKYMQSARLLVQREIELASARNESKQVRQDCAEQTTRLQAEAEQAVTEAQVLLDQQIAAMRAESERVRQHYETEARKIQDSANALIANSASEAERLKKYESLLNAEDEVQRVLGAAMAEASALRDQARTLLEQAGAEADVERTAARERAREIYEQAEARLNQATKDAGRIIAEAEARAQEIGGDAYTALRDKQQLEQAAQAMRHIIEGYGDQYIIPTHSLLDDLAAEFGYTSAGEALKSARAQSRRMVEQGAAATCAYVEDNRRETAIRFVIDAFNGRVDAILSRIRHDNYGVLEQEIRDAFALVNLNGQAFRDAQILPAYLDSRLAELKWAVVVQELAKKQREEQRYLKERLRDEEKARKEYEAKLREAAKEEELKKKALADMEQELAAAQAAFAHAAAAEKAQWEAKILELQRANQGLKDDLDVATAKTLTIAQQTKKGHVYIISNIGSFGDGVYKIGQTRRLNKQDRIDELSDASVPFSFDVHAWIESENAPVLEHKLQKRFLTMQMNKMNSRKEFFRVSLKDLRVEIEALQQEEAFAVTHWTDVAAATEYRESLDVESNPQKLKKWLRREDAVTDKQIRLDSIGLSQADVADTANDSGGA